MAAIGLAIALPATIVLRSSEKEEPAGTSIEEAVPLNPEVANDELEADYQVPEGWTLVSEGEEEDQILKLSSRDDAVQVGISAPAPAHDSAKVLDTALEDLRRIYGKVKVGRGSGKKIGGLDAKGAVVSARNEKEGVDLSILVAVGEGRKRTYLVEVFSPAGAPPKSVAEAQRLLDSLRLKG
jgi:hypothetical protein